MPAAYTPVDFDFTTYESMPSRPSPISCTVVHLGEDYIVVKRRSSWNGSDVYTGIRLGICRPPPAWQLDTELELDLSEFSTFVACMGRLDLAGNPILTDESGNRLA